MGSLDSAAVREYLLELQDLIATKNGHWFEGEMDKLENWADDRRVTLRGELALFEKTIKDLKKQARLAANLPEKLALHRELRMAETQRDTAWRALEEASREIERKKDALLDEISQRLQQMVNQVTLFTLRWQLA